MRLDEVIALKWDNVDLVNGVITVCVSYRKVRKYNEDGTSYNTTDKKKPKTEKGFRSIPIPKFLNSELKKHKLTSPKSPVKLVFCTRNGTPLQSANIRRTHINICKRANIRQITFHALSHTFATHMIENQVDVKTVSELLGHSSIEITLNTYVHSTNKSKRAAANVQENFYNNLMNAY